MTDYPTVIQQPAAAKRSARKDEARVGQQRHSHALAQPVRIHGVDCMLSRAGDGYAIRAGGGHRG